MSTVPFLYVNIGALCCYVLLFTAFMAARKTPEIKAFLVMLVSFVLWTGGSILMRLQLWPGLGFWYYISLEGLFASMPLLYFFVCSFAKVKGYFLKSVWAAGTALILILTPFGFFLKPPTPTLIEGVGTVFLYDMGWPIIIPYAFFLCVVLSIALIFRRLIKEKGLRTPGLQEILAGCLCLAVGNIVQIFPNNTFPYDTLSGICFALLVMVAMVRKRMFRMQLLISRNVLLLISTIIFGMCCVNFIAPLEELFLTHTGLDNSGATVAVVMTFTALLLCISIIIRRIIDAVFTREEQQNRVLNDFSRQVNHSLDVDEIMERLVKVIKDEIAVSQVYVCLRDGDRFRTKRSFSPLTSTSFAIKADSPCVAYLQEDEPLFLLSEFKFDPRYMSLWDEEKALLASLDISCVAALKDGEEIIGLMLLANKERRSAYTYMELSFLTTVCSVASIAVKNAALYEKMYREARIDSLTGVYNYRFFIEDLNNTYAQQGNDNLALAYIDLDDLKLYNQLYGVSEGDEMLRRVAQLLLRCVGQQGQVFRTSGKVFALLLPGFDGRQAYTLLQDIKERIAAINTAPGRGHMRPMSVSCGLCVSPFAASSAKELSDNADLAVYQAKSAGKDKIVVFRSAEDAPQSISEKAMRIIDQDNEGGSGVSRYSSALFALTAAIDAKDHYTCNHSLNVAHYAAVLATAIGLNDEQVRMTYEAGLLHDIGKISVPEQILNKETRLDQQEFTIMQAHVNNSIEIIRHLPAMDYLIPAAVGHHERWDGQGYPRGLSGEEIPVTARCLALADAFDAMTTDRTYRKRLSLEYAAKEIEDNIGAQFDPQLAVTFIQLALSGELHRKTASTGPANDNYGQIPI